MTTSCPYCGAALNLNYCVVCGRQSSPLGNKMGTLKTVARNTDVTQRLEDPLQEKQVKRQQNLLRLQRIAKFIVKVIIACLIIGILIFCATTQITNVYQMPGLLAPWIKSHRITFPNQLPHSLSAIEQSIVTATQQATHKLVTPPDKHKRRAEKIKAKPKSK